MPQAPGNRQDIKEDGEKKSWLVGLLKSDRALPVLILGACIGFALYLTMESRVFPAASIDLKLSRPQVAALSRQYASKFGYNALGKGVIESTTFTYAADSKTFLEYQLGAARANQLMKDTIPVWSWTTRFCKELDLEQFRVWLSPQGMLTAFQLNIEDERPLPSLSHEQALQLAQDFLTKEANLDLTKLKLVSNKSASMAHRDDHSFTWEDQINDYKGAHLRYYVYVSGDRVTTYSTTLKVPDKWTRQYGNMRSYNELLHDIASLFYGPMEYLAFLVVPLALSRRMMRYRVAIFGGLLMALVAGLDTINEFSSVVDSYSPNVSFRDYLTSYYFREILSFIGTFISGACLFGGADVVYRYAYPKRVALENYVAFKGFKTLEGLKALIVGHCVFAVHLGWIIAYYLLGDKLGFWCPLGLDSYQILGSQFPFFSAISLGVHAACREETVARVVALSLAQKLTGKFWVANLFQAAAWGFMHSTYAQQPSYARGVELTCAGLFYGWILRRYGLLPCVIGHYLVDAFLDVKPVFEAQSPGLFLSAFIPIVPFLSLLIAASILVAHSKNVPASEAPLSNAALPVAEPHEKPEGEAYTPLQYKPLGRNIRWRMAAVAAAGLTFALWSHTPAPGDQCRLTCDRSQAVAKANAIMTANGLDPAKFVVVPTLTASLSSDQLQYISEKVGKSQTIALARTAEPGFLWLVRYFKFMESDQYSISLTGDGREYSFGVVEDDDTPGKKLNSEEAKTLALAYMHRVHPEYKDLLADKVSLDARKDRSDWTVDFKVPSLSVGEATYRTSLMVVGGVPCNFEQHWNVPNSWTQERLKKSTNAVWLGHLRTLCLFIVGIIALWWAVGVLRAGHLNWKAALIVSLVCGAFFLVEQANNLPVLFLNYETKLTRDTFLYQHLLEIISGSSVSIVTNFLYVAFALAAYRLLKPGVSITTLLGTALRPLNRESKLLQENLWVDGVLIALLWEALYQTKESILDWFYFWFSPEITGAHLWTLCSLPDYIAPAASDVLELFPSFVTTVAGYLIAASILQRFAPRFSRFLLLFVIYQLIQASGAKHISDYFISVSGKIFDKILLWFVIVRWARFNPIVYLTKIVLDDALPFLDSIVVYAWPCMAPFFVSFAFYLLLPFLALLYVRVRNRSEGQALAKGKVSQEV